jgi:hypothetical protein
MQPVEIAPPTRDRAFVSVMVILGASALAFMSARPYAGSWQDGSRLANVEALVDHHRWAIDDSIFVRVPDYPPGRGPYPPDEPALLQRGTCDKLYIKGHYYADRPVPALLMAGLYQVWEWCGGQTARQRPDRFCLALTLASAGAAYVIAVWCVYRLGLALGLPLAQSLALTASFGLATVALTYSRHVNAHILLLAIAAALFLGLIRLPRLLNRRTDFQSVLQTPGEMDGLKIRPAVDGVAPWLRVAWIGSLAGVGYTCDLGGGPVLLVCMLPLIAWRTRRMSMAAVFLLAALPWVALHHGVNFAIGGTFRPINSVPEYSVWPGSPFNAENLTGAWNHSLGHFAMYAVAMLAGKRGFLGHNLPLFLALPGIVLLFRRRPAGLAEAVFGCSWAAGMWLLYAALSNNYAGVCCSVRWFVPLLVPGYYVLALLLREYPEYCWDFCVLSGWGALMAGLMWWQGPWMKHMVPYFWPLQVGGLMSWLACRRWQRRVLAAGPSQSIEQGLAPAA